MAITKDQIATALNSRLGSRGATATTLADPIRATLYDMSLRGPLADLHTSTPAALVAGTTQIAKPSDMAFLDKIVLNDGTVDGSPLTLVGFGDVLRHRDGDTASSRDEPDVFAPRGGYYELYPASDGSYTATIYYYRIHPDQETILFGEPFREALYLGVMAQYLEGLSLEFDPKAAYYRQRYEQEIARAFNRQTSDPVTVDYVDI